MKQTILDADVLIVNTAIFLAYGCYVVIVKGYENDLLILVDAQLWTIFIFEKPKEENCLIFK